MSNCYLTNFFCKNYLLFFVLIFASCHSFDKKSYSTWSVYGGTKDAMHYSSLAQMDTAIVSRLKIAWIYHTGDADTAVNTQIQCNPVIIDTTLFALSAKMKLFALNAATGKLLWTFDPVQFFGGSSSPDSKLSSSFSNTGRGVTYWTDGKEDKRIFETADY